MMTKQRSGAVQTARRIAGRSGEWLKANFNSLLISLLLALTVWIVAMQEQNPSMEFEMETPIRIDVVGLDPSLMITNNYPESVKIRLRAQQNTIPSISAEDVIVIADLEGFEPGSHQVQLKVDIAAQAIILSTNPTNIRVDIESVANRELPIRMRFLGELPTGYAYSANDITGLPEIATITGPESSVDKISEISASIDIEGLRETFRGDVRLQAWDNNGNEIDDVTINPGVVNLTLPIEQEAGYKEVTLRVPTTGHPATGYYMTSRLVTPQVITIQGDPAIIDTLPPLMDTQLIDLTGLRDDLIQEVSLTLPAGVSVVGDPVVQVLITIAAQQDSRSLFIDVETVGLGQGLSARIDPRQVEVFLSGPLPALQALDPYADIVISVELFDLTPGVYQITPLAQVADSSISIDSILPAEIEVEISRN